jgi:hypothetical protein
MANFNGESTCLILNQVMNKIIDLDLQFWAGFIHQT